MVGAWRMRIYFDMMVCSMNSRFDSEGARLNLEPYILNLVA